MVVKQNPYLNQIIFKIILKDNIEIQVAQGTDPDKEMLISENLFLDNRRI